MPSAQSQEATTYYEVHGDGHMLVLVERKSRFLRLRHAQSPRLSSVVAKASVGAPRALSAHSITFDNSSEFERGQHAGPRLDYW